MSIPSRSEPGEGGPVVESGRWIQVLWSRRAVVLASTALAIAIALIYLEVATYKYTATLSITPVETPGGGGLASQLGNLGGLASLAGVSLPMGQGTASFQLYLETLKSRAVADELAKREELMHIVFRDEWDAAHGHWRPPTNAASVAKYAVARLLGPGVFTWRPPDGARLQRYLDERVAIGQSSKKQIVALTFSHQDPQFAEQLLSTLHGVTDNLLRRRTLTRASENIAYLTTRLDSVVNVEHERALAQALSEQERLHMMASSTAPFAAEPFGVATASPRPTSPQPVLVLVAFAVLGAFVASGVVLFAEAWRSRIFAF